ncbi:hypothetical protein H8E07_17060 [bacterium]|nr:hypothetical protein [bacterium]
MERRRVRDHEEAVELLSALAASGLPLAEFCRSRGIDGRSLHCWQLNLRPPTPPSSGGLRLMELSVAVPDRPVAGYRIRFDGVEIEVDDHFREETLGRLLQVLAC